MGATTQKYILFLLCACVIFFCSSRSAEATATADVEFTVDWSTFTITGGSYSVTSFEYKGLHSEGWINGPDSSNPSYAASSDTLGTYPTYTNWDNPILTHTIGNNTATLSASSSNLTEQTSSSSSGAGDQTGWINGNIHRGLQLVLNPETTYTFSFDYSLDVSLGRDNADQENASNYSQVAQSINFFSPSGTNLSSIVDPFNSNFAGDGLGYSLYQENTLQLTFTTLSDDAYALRWSQYSQNPEVSYGTYWLETHMHTSTSTASTYISDPSTQPVPEPATMLLFGTGIVGLAGSRLRRKK